MNCNTYMKKFIYSIVALVLSTVTFAENVKDQALKAVENPEISIKSAKIPMYVQTLVGEHLGGVVNLKRISKGASILKLSTFNGLNVEIAHKNNTIKKIKSSKESVPVQLLTYFPGEVSNLITSQFTGWELTEIASSQNGYEAELKKLKQKIHLKFDSSGFCHYTQYR